MKMKIYNILTACLLLALSSCYKEMPFRGMQTDPQLYFECLPGAQDTTVFWLRSTIPVNQLLVDRDIFNAVMTFKVNGEEVRLHRNAGQSSSFPENAYFTTKPLSGGDKLEFYAEADGYEPISAQTIIPQELNDITLSSMLIPSPNPDYYIAAIDDRASQNIGEIIPKFNVTFQDEPGVRNYYMVEVIETVYSDKGNLLLYDESAVYVVPRINTDMFEQAQSDVILANYNSPWQTIQYDRTSNSRLVMFFDDKEFDGLKYTKEIMVNRHASRYTTKYILRIYRVSEELYKYVKAWYTVRQAEFSDLPSSTPFMAYNNIKGGNGIFAGVTVFESELIEFE